MSTPRVLVVDDESAMLRSVERILDNEYEVRTSTSSTAAAEIAREFRPNLAIVDIRMPDMDGYELMNALKEIDRNIHVILMTGSVYDLDEQLIRAIREKAFYYINKPFDREVLRTLVQRSVELHSLENAHRRHVEHLESQLSEARAFQDTMLPAPRARIEGFEIHAGYQPCAELAGDLYDYAPAGEGCVALLIADVVGHGASAAMLTSIVKSAFHASQAEDHDPVAVVRRTAESIAAFDVDRFVTLVCARICLQDGVLEYVNAGHTGGLLSSRGQTGIALRATGPFVSPALSHAKWNRQTLPWNRESSLLLYTDGIPETSNGKVLFGIERIHSLAREQARGGEELVTSILADVRAFGGNRPSADDVTLLSVRNP